MADVASNPGQFQSWKIHGIKELQAKLDAMGKGKKLSSVLRSAVRAGMNKVKSDAASRLITSPNPDADTYAPGYLGHQSYKGNWLLPGFAKRHVKLETYVSRDKQSATAVVGPVKEAFYASQFVEFGIPSRGYSAHPWLVPAFSANRSLAISELTKKIQQRLVQLARQKPVGVKR